MRGTIEKELGHMQFLARSMQGCDISSVALVVLLELNIPTNHIGFDYLLNAVVLFYKDSQQTLNRGIYPAVAACYKYDMGNEELEQAMRNAIKNAWKNRDEAVWKYYFSQGNCDRIKKPTNSEFISRIGRVLQLWQGCCKEEVGHEER